MKDFNETKVSSIMHNVRTLGFVVLDPHLPPHSPFTWTYAFSLHPSPPLDEGTDIIFKEDLTDIIWE